MDLIGFLFAFLPFRSRALTGRDLPGFQFLLHLPSSFPLPMFYTPSIFTWNSVKTLSPLGVLLVYFLHWDQGHLSWGVLVFCDKPHSAGFIETSLFKSLTVFGEADQASRFPCPVINQSQIRHIWYVVCFPCNSREGWGALVILSSWQQLPWRKLCHSC